jgi:hypothetical protein
LTLIERLAVERGRLSILSLIYLRRRRTYVLVLFLLVTSRLRQTL